MQDFVRAGVLRPVQPTVSSGFTAYDGGGRLFLPAAHESNTAGVASALRFSAANASGFLLAAQGTYACRLVPLYALDDSAHHEIVRTSDARIWITHYNNNRWVLGINNVTSYAQSAVLTGAAGVPHFLVGRWVDATSLDLNHDGTDVAQVSHATAAEAYTSFSIGGETATREATAHIGPFIISPARKTDGWVTAIQANSGAAYSSIPRLVRDFMAVGDYIAPLGYHSTAYTRVA